MGISTVIVSRDILVALANIEDNKDKLSTEQQNQAKASLFRFAVLQGLLLTFSAKSEIQEMKRLGGANFRPDGADIDTKMHGADLAVINKQRQNYMDDLKVRHNDPNTENSRYRKCR